MNIPSAAEIAKLTGLNPRLCGDLEEAARRIQAVVSAKGYGFAVFKEFAKGGPFSLGTLEHAWVRARNADKPAKPSSAPQATDTPPTTSTGLLGAAKAIQEQRAKDYDQPGGERSMRATVDTFNIFTRRTGERALSESEGWLLMVCLKLVRERSQAGKPHRDSIEDEISYSALYGEARLAEELGSMEQLARDMADAPYKSAMNEFIDPRVGEEGSPAKTAIDLLLEACDNGQFADDFDQPLAKPIRKALRQHLNSVGRWTVTP